MQIKHNNFLSLTYTCLSTQSYMKITTTLFLVLIFCTIGPSQENIFTTISESEDHKIFTELLEIVELDQILQDEDYYSVFAPDDDAFLTQFPGAELDSLKQNIDSVLYDLLRHHIVPTKVIEVDLFDEHLPLYGNRIGQFIDAAGLTIFSSGNSSSPHPQLRTFDPVSELENGQILWLTKNLMHISYKNIQEEINFLPTLLPLRPDLLDSIYQSENDLTIIIGHNQEIEEYLLENDGFNNEAFLDSFLTRQIIDGLYPLQKITDGLMVETWLGDMLWFTVIQDRYYVNHVEIEQHFCFRNGVALFVTEPLEAAIYSSIDDNIQNLELTIYPNPATNTIKINNPSKHRFEYVSIYNHLGSLVQSIPYEEEIDLSHHESGLYILQLQNEKFTWSEKVLIIK